MLASTFLHRESEVQVLPNPLLPTPAFGFLCRLEALASVHPSAWVLSQVSKAGTLETWVWKQTSMQEIIHIHTKKGETGSGVATRKKQAAPGRNPRESFLKPGLFIGRNQTTPWSGDSGLNTRPRCYMQRCFQPLSHRCILSGRAWLIPHLGPLNAARLGCQAWGRALLEGLL